MEDPDISSFHIIRRHLTGGAVSFGESADVCTETEEVNVATLCTESSKTTRLLLAGGIAGSTGKTITAPLSRITILFQVHSMVSSSGKGEYSNSIIGAMRKVVTREGILAFWKGNGTSVIHRFPYSAMNFLAYETVKDTLSQRYPNLEHTAKVRFISGAMAGASATMLCYPLDLVRTRLATQLDAQIQYRGIAHAFHRISTEEGLRGLFRGVGPTLGVAIPNLAINFTIYETLKDHMRVYRGISKQKDGDEKAEHHLKISDTLICGGISGIVSSSLTFPIDVIRRRMQLSGMYCKISGSQTAIEIASTLYTEQGARGFYRGLAPELLKVIPMVSITFGSFERLKHILDIS